ncbi:MAG: hypothetical protein ACP5KA_06840 [Desulfurococcaceae archaeon]
MSFGSPRGKVVRIELYMRSSDYVYNFTGKVSKAILLTELPELEVYFRPVKGYFKPLRVSPPLKDGMAVTPYYDKSGELRPVAFDGEYVVEAGLPAELADKVAERLSSIAGVKTRLKFENAVLEYIVSKVDVLEPRVRLGSVVVVKSASPALLPSPLLPSQHVRRFTTAPWVVFWVPYALYKGVLSHDYKVALEAAKFFEECLAEHYSTKSKTVFVNYDGKREPTLMLRARYIMLREECRSELAGILETARVFGIGSSRASGFGSILDFSNFKLPTSREE